MQSLSEIKGIKNVDYKRDSKRKGNQESFIVYIENLVTFEDDSQGLRIGIQNVHGATIKEMTASLLVATEPCEGQSQWYSLQTTSSPELKAAYRAGFRNQNLSSLEAHLKAFKDQCGTLQVEKIA